MPHPNVNRQDRPARSKQIAVLHIPHSSRRVPNEERQAILLDDVALGGELLRMTDAYTDELFPVTPLVAAITGAPALIIFASVRLPAVVPSVTRAAIPMPATTVAQISDTATILRWVMRSAVTIDV
jgi:hypothetical protein